MLQRATTPHLRELHKRGRALGLRHVAVQLQHWGRPARARRAAAARQQGGACGCAPHAREQRMVQLHAVTGGQEDDGLAAGWRL